VIRRGVQVIALGALAVVTLVNCAAVSVGGRVAGVLTSFKVVPSLFLLVAGWLLVNTLVATPTQAAAGLFLMMLGLPFYFYWSRRAAPVDGVARQRN
jgi:amino acid transporter